MSRRSHWLQPRLLPGLFWIGYWLLFVWLLSNFQPYRTAIPVATVTVAVQGGVTYLNVHYLIPTYLGRGRCWTYGLWVLAIVILVPLLAIWVKGHLITTSNLLMGHASRLYQLTRLSFLFFLVMLFSTSYTLTVNFVRGRQHQTEQEKEQLSSELTSLKNQLNPHFLFNTLNNMYTLAYFKDAKTAPMILKLSELMRYMLYECRDDKTLLEKEVRFVSNLVAMQRLKSETFAERIRLTAEGIAPHHGIAPLLLLVFLENSFKYCDLDYNPLGYIDITIQAGADNQLRFSCVNTRRRPESNGPRSGGIGLANVKKRLELIYPNTHSLFIEDQPDHFAVHLTLPLR